MRLVVRTPGLLLARTFRSTACDAPAQLLAIDIIEARHLSQIERGFDRNMAHGKRNPFLLSTVVVSHEGG
jgi:hypothetical protein